MYIDNKSLHLPIRRCLIDARMLPGAAQLLQQKRDGHAVNVARLRGTVQIDVRMRIDPHQRQIGRVLQVTRHGTCTPHPPTTTTISGNTHWN